MFVLGARCEGGFPRAPREGVRDRTGQFALWGGGLTPRLCRGPPRVRVCWRGTPQASRLLACGKGGCVAARDKPPSCVPQGRGVAPQASRLLACGKGGSSGIFAWWEAPICAPDGGEELSFLETRCCPLPSPLRGVRGRTGQAAFLRAARAGGCTPGEPPSCLRQGRGFRVLSLGGNTRTQGNDTHARASASGPKREVKFFRPFEKRRQQGSNVGAEGIYPHQGPPP